MKTTPNAGNADTFAKKFEITAQIPLSRLRAVARGKQKSVLVLAQVPIQKLAQLNAHWYESMLVSLTFDPKDKVFKVHVSASQAQQLTYAKAGVQRGKRRGLRPLFVTPDGLPVNDSSPARA
jgi:hypothetical protein